jgi:putative ABC transport system permease protein
MRREIFSEALNSIKGNILRAILTVSIIAIGITSLVGSLTAAKGLERALLTSFGKLGTGSFFIRAVQGENCRRISYWDVRSFQSQYDCNALIVPYVKVDTGLSGVSSGPSRTNPDVEVIGADGIFVEFNGGTVATGRNFSHAEVVRGSDVAILGSRVAGALFPGVPTTDATVNVLGRIFRVVGVLVEMGGGGGSLDNIVIVPLEGARNGLLSGEESYVIGVSPRGEVDMGAAVDQATSVMRVVRRLSPEDGDDFQIRRRDSLLSKMENMMRMVTLAAFMIGFITLTGASVGLMNIMLVSVKERSAEIGVRKAIGSTEVAIRDLFMTEAMIIGGAGGALGVVFGVVAGGIVSAILEIPFEVPWGWIGVSLVVSMAVCVISCLLPASRAAALEPVEALRGE